MPHICHPRLNGIINDSYGYTGASVLQIMTVYYRLKDTGEEGKNKQGSQGGGGKHFLIHAHPSLGVEKQVGRSVFQMVP